MPPWLTDLIGEVTAGRTVYESAVLLIAGITQQIIAGGNSPRRLLGLVDDLNLNSISLATAVETNTVPKETF